MDKALEQIVKDIITISFTVIAVCFVIYICFI